jgi:raffinose/stachyose/melibiose transport system permease protein
MRSFSGRWAPYLYLAPIVLIAGLLLYFSIGFAALASLTDWNGLTRWELVGLDNYRELFQDRTFYIALGNTVKFMVVTVVMQAALGLLVAVIAKERIPGSNFFKALFFAPIAMAPAIIATVFKYMLESNYGSLNETLRAVGLLGQNDSIQWLGADLGVWSISAINIFSWMGFSMMVYFAGLMSIPDELYEAAELDGAGWWRQLFSITIPSLRGTTSVLITLGIVGSLKAFDLVWLTTQGGPGVSTHFLSTFLYQARLDREAGYSSAIGIVVLVIAFALALVQMRLSAREK